MPPQIKLHPMSQEQYFFYLKADLPRYAAENVQAGFWSETEALVRAKETYDRFLPHGVETPGQHLYMICNQYEEEIGMIWIGTQPGGVKASGFVYNLYIEEGFRRQGYGRAAMVAAEEQARELGWTSLALHVFGHNQAARKLYESLGYEVRSMNMVKQLISGALDPASTES